MDVIRKNFKLLYPPIIHLTPLPKQLLQSMSHIMSKNASTVFRDKHDVKQQSMLCMRSRSVDRSHGSILNRSNQQNKPQCLSSLASLETPGRAFSPGLKSPGKSARTLYQLRKRYNARLRKNPEVST